MRVLVHEYASAGGAPLPPSIVAEGCAMRDALCADLAAVAEVELWVSTASGRLAPPCGQRLAPRAEESDANFLLRAAANVDAVWLVAPESEGIALDLTRRLEQAGIATLGCTSEAVALASSKSRTLARLAGAGISTVPTWPLEAAPFERHEAWAVKPDCGCGCEEARRLASAEAKAWREALRHRGGNKAYIVQPWLQGMAMSLSLRVAAGRAELLSINRQHIAIAADGSLSLSGLTRGFALPPQADAGALVRRIVQAMPGLRGFVGVDFVLGVDGRATVLEVNPRLTSAYVGLSALLRRNLAAEILSDFIAEACHA